MTKEVLFTKNPRLGYSVLFTVPAFHLIGSRRAFRANMVYRLGNLILSSANFMGASISVLTLRIKSAIHDLVKSFENSRARSKNSMSLYAAPAPMRNYMLRTYLLIYGLDTHI